MDGQGVMGNFNFSIRRLEAALNDPYRAKDTHRRVTAKDLRGILHHFNRVDLELRTILAEREALKEKMRDVMENSPAWSDTSVGELPADYLSRRYQK